MTACGRAPDTDKNPATPVYHWLIFPEQSGHNTKEHGEVRLSVQRR
ncbi:TPA: hypothetical protein ACXKGF_004229 [Escherichia coli]